MSGDRQATSEGGEPEDGRPIGWRRRAVAYATAPLTAASFLTVVPVPTPGAGSPGGMGAGLACFPLLGAALAVLLATADRLIGAGLPQAVSAALILSALLAITGALHLDALMDCFDGLFGGKDPASRLLIMRDSRVGSYGLAAAAGVLLTEYSCLVSLPVAQRGLGLVVALALSRWAMTAALWAFPAPPGSGLAASLKVEIGIPQIGVATGIAIALAVWVLGWAGAATWAGAGLVTWLGGRVLVSRVGGVNGDGCGALGQLVEATALVGFVALQGSA